MSRLPEMKVGETYRVRFIVARHEEECIATYLGIGFGEDELMFDLRPVAGTQRMNRRLITEMERVGAVAHTGPRRV